MLYGASNGHMTNDVTSPQKVKVVTPIYLEPNISRTAGDRESVTMEHLQEMLYGASNDHMPNDVTWPQKVKVVTPICLGPNISKTAGDTDTVTMEQL